MATYSLYRAHRALVKSSALYREQGAFGTQPFSPAMGPFSLLENSPSKSFKMKNRKEEHQ
jgi:hypothetical protein